MPKDLIISLENIKAQGYDIPKEIKMSREFYDLLKKECKTFLVGNYSDMNNFAGIRVVIDDSVTTWRVENDRRV